jgi:hypothetical protein
MLITEMALGEIPDVQAAFAKARAQAVFRDFSSRRGPVDLGLSMRAA